MIAFRDEFVSFRDVSSKTVTTLDLIFKKCPVCGRERQIADKDEYLLKIRRPGKPTLYFDRESCKRKYLAQHPELLVEPVRGRSPERIAKFKAERAKRAQEYLKLVAQGFNSNEIGKMFGKSGSSVRATIERYNEDCIEAVTV